MRKILVVGQLRVFNTKLILTDGYRVLPDKNSVSLIHRKNLQDYTVFHFVGPHNDNEVWKHRL